MFGFSKDALVAILVKQSVLMRREGSALPMVDLRMLEFDFLGKRYWYALWRMYLIPGRPTDAGRYHASLYHCDRVYAFPVSVDYIVKGWESVVAFGAGCPGSSSCGLEGAITLDVLL